MLKLVAAACLALCGLAATAEVSDVDAAPRRARRANRALRAVNPRVVRLRQPRRVIVVPPGTKVVRARR